MTFRSDGGSPGCAGSFGIDPLGSRGDPARRLVPERYVARAELAAIMGVSLATVDRMVADGMPSVTWGRRTRRFRPSAAISWALERERAA
jgi:hypothetical protein